MVEGIEFGTGMSSYTHICAACGQRMTVHERYHGRTLRCRDCGERFLADPSEYADGTSEIGHTCLACGTEMTVAMRFVGRELSCTECGEKFTPRPPVQVETLAEDPDRTETEISESGEPEPRSRYGRAVLYAAVGVVVVGLLMWWLGGDHETGVGGSLFRTQKARAQIGELHFEHAPTVPVALDRESVAELSRIAKTGEGPAARPAFESPRFLQISAGTRVRVIETQRGGQARVRILAGPQNSRIVWVPIDWVK
jgi:DNA-directed RNA polymerase subunit RPC12/RpoP